MKVFAKRDKYKVFKKARIEIDDLEDFVALKMAVKHYVEYMENMGWHTEEHKNMNEIYMQVKRVLDALDIKNERQWND